AEPRAREERDRRDDEEAAVDPHVAHGLAGHEHVAAGTLEGQELHHDDPPDAETEETGQPAPRTREEPRGEDGPEREHEARAATPRPTSRPVPISTGPRLTRGPGPGGRARESAAGGSVELV